jgi:hypothetical protein
MYDLLGNNFIDMIKSFYPNAKPASGRSEVVVRCPFCQDSKNPNHAHMYISVPRTVEDLSQYHCKLCSAHGIFNDDVLRKLGCYNSNTLVAISKHNADIMKLPKYKTLKNINIYPLKNSMITDNKFSQMKLKYINERIGSNFSYNDILSLKIFINLYDVINYNKLQLNRDQRICNQLNNSFIGFISYDNSFATLRRVLFTRNLDKSIDKRYINYNLIDKIDDNKNFYIIPTKIDTMNPNKVKIHITEGAFDLLSVFYNLNNCCIDQCIYIASGGKSYKQALQFVLHETGIMNYEIHIYPDKDVNDYELYRLIILGIQMLPSNIFIHRNMMDGEKDYGVPKERIIDSVNMISDVYE